MFDKLLIANRGEIACRVIRTARRMGLRTVAVYSDADAAARHVAFADEAVCIGTAPARDSYLCSDRIVAAALATGARAVHPGYGFLSENAAFAEACNAAGLVFVGPPAAAIRSMGDKSAAKALMVAAGVPVVPGYHGEDQDDAVLAREAARIGFPVLIKAAAGGGGKGMRSVRDAAAFAPALAAARREAGAAFGDDRVLVERYLERPRHIEVQVFCDRHGNAVHLFERDCSLQRRHQKVVEEAPAPGIDAELRERMGAAAVAAARAVAYEGAGTVEFIADTDGTFYFMEMNTRLQVEHPVTELVTGQDLVEWQLRVAAGEPLPRRQPDLRLDGSAIEVRLYAEDPAHDFLPATGHLVHLRFPAAEGHVRVDTGVREGDAVTVHYDPLLAKIIVWDRARDAAVRRLRRALHETEVVGVTTNLDFLATVAAHPEFTRGGFDTGFVERNRDVLMPAAEGNDDTLLAIAALARVHERAAVAAEAARSSGDPWSPWHAVNGWRLSGGSSWNMRFAMPATERAVEIAFAQSGGLTVDTGHGPATVQVETVTDGMRATIGGRQSTARLVRSGDRLTVLGDGRRLTVRLLEPGDAEAAAEAGTGSLVSPMPGTVVAVLVEPGAVVRRGMPLMVLEAMKMEHTITAPLDGTVRLVHYRVGDSVPREGIELLLLDPDDLSPVPGPVDS